MKTEDQESIDSIIRRGSQKQRLVCVLIGVLCTIESIETYITNFSTPYQEFWCSVPQIRNCSSAKQKELVLPQISSHKNQDYCSVTNRNWSHNERLCDFANDLVKTEGDIVKCETGFQFNNSIFTLTATGRFQLVCDYGWVHDLISPVFMASFIIGSFLSGFISDGYGRKLSLLIFLVGHTFGGIIVAFAPSVWLFLAGRILVGASSRGIAISAITLLVELVPTKKTEYAGMIFEINLCSGTLIVTFLSYFIRDYRWLQLSASLLYCPLFLFWTIIPESPLWLVSKGYYGRASSELTRLYSWANRANTSIDENIFEDHLKSEKHCSKSQLSITELDEYETNLSIRDIFKYDKFVIYIIASSLGNLSSSGSYVSAALNMGLLFGDIYMNIAISGLLELSAVFVFCFILDKFGRKTLIQSFQVLQILFNLAQILLTLLPGYDLATTIVALVCKLMPCLVLPLISVTISELFPAEVRQQALGYSMGFSSMIICFCPLIGGKLKLIWAPIPNIVFGFLIFLSFVAFLFVPETKNRKIPNPNTLEDPLQEDSQHNKKNNISNILPPDHYIHNSEFIGVYRYFGK